MIPKKTTKMIVKDGNGGYLQLLPEAYTDSALNASSSDPISNAAATSALNAAADRMAELSLFKVMEEEPTALNTQGTADKAIFAWIQPENWSITVDTSKYNGWGSTHKTGQVPLVFNASDASSQNASMNIEWGDGTSTTYTPATAYGGTYPEHEYAETGIYTITINSDFFEKLYIPNVLTDEGEAFGPAICIHTLKSINSSLPKIAGVFDYYSNSYINNSFSGAWWAYRQLESIPFGLFDNNPDVTDFTFTFCLCESLNAIPNGLFDYNTKITSLNGCFSGCTSVSDFTLHIKSTEVNDCYWFIDRNENTTRIVYVPSGSTTQTTFDNEASSLGVIVIAE